MVQGNRAILGHVVKCLTSAVEDTKAADVVAEVDHLVEMIKSQFTRMKLHHKKNIDNRIEYTYGYLVAGKLCLMHEFIGKAHGESERKIFNIDVTITPAHYDTVYTPMILNPKEMDELGRLSLVLSDKAKDLAKVIPVMSSVLEKAEKHLTEKLSKIIPEGRGATVQTMNLVKDLFKYTSANLPKLSLDANRVVYSVTGYIKESTTLHEGLSNA
jgi:hypothetical protein